MKIFMRIIVLVLMSAVVSCSKPPEAPVRLGTNIWPGYEPLYLARNLGMFSNADTRLIQFPSASEVIDAFRRGAIDAASLTLDEALLLAQDNIPIRIILVHDISNGADVILAREPIRRVEDLQGHTVAVESGALGAFVLTRALQVHGLRLEDVLVRHNDVDRHEDAYIQGKVDAVVTFEPVRTRLLALGANEIFSSSEIPGEIVDVLVVHKHIHDTRGKQLQNLVNAWFTALEYMQKPGSDYATIMSGRLKIGREEVINSYKGLDLPGRYDNALMLHEKTGTLIPVLENLSTVLVDNGLLRAPSNVVDLPSGKYVSE